MARDEDDRPQSPAAAFNPRAALLSVAQMYAADRLAMAGGVSGLSLMERAGRAVAEVAARFAPRRVVVLCGPGNNGGDGFVAARHLQERGGAAQVALLGPRAALKGDAAAMAERWNGPLAPLAPAALAGADLVIDALFGAGLDRPITGIAAETLAAVAAAGLPVVAVDVPSGVHGDTGQALGPAVAARATVTFFRRKPGHLLLPGRVLCGEVIVADIGIPETVLATIRPDCFANGPDLWRALYPRPRLEGHKYDRGHAVVVSGGALATGAARMAAGAALRLGAGLVTVASPSEAAAINAAHLTAVMVRACEEATDLAALLADRRFNAVLLGPGGGRGERMREKVAAALAPGAAPAGPGARAVVLDADALTSFAEAPEALFAAIAAAAGPVVLTPHEGEFARLFPDLALRSGLPAVGEGAGKLARARAAARRSGAVVVLKGADTVIAAPGGEAAINDNAPPWLATAGAGDVLAGFVTGLLAQGMPAFAAAAAAVWVQGACAARFGPGLIAEDLEREVPAVLRDLLAVAGQEDGAARQG